MRVTLQARDTSQPAARLYAKCIVKNSVEREMAEEPPGGIVFPVPDGYLRAGHHLVKAAVRIVVSGGVMVPTLTTCKLPAEVKVGLTATGSDWSTRVNHNTTVYQYRPCTQRHCIVPAHCTHSAHTVSNNQSRMR